MSLPPLARVPLPPDPSSGRPFVVTDHYGTRGGEHYGVDLATRDEDGRPVVGVPVFSALSSPALVRVGEDSRSGLYVVTTTAAGDEALYAHLLEVYVETGDVVSGGALLGTSGMSGSATGPHLHFELRPGGRRPGIDPLPYLEAAASSSSSAWTWVGLGSGLLLVLELLRRRRR